jgi:hypothetical protein
LALVVGAEGRGVGVCRVEWWVGLGEVETGGDVGDAAVDPLVLAQPVSVTSKAAARAQRRCEVTICDGTWGAIKAAVAIWAVVSRRS